jgi:hypothetical protein
MDARIAADLHGFPFGASLVPGRRPCGAPAAVLDISEVPGVAWLASQTSDRQFLVS